MLISHWRLCGRRRMAPSLQPEPQCKNARGKICAPRINVNLDSCESYESSFFSNLIWYILEVPTAFDYIAGHEIATGNKVINNSSIGKYDQGS